MGATEEHVAEFRRCIDELPGVWRTLDLRIVALKAGDGWYNLVARCLLTSRPPRKVPRVAHWPRTPSLLAMQHVVGVATLPALLESILDGELLLKGTRILFKTPPESTDRAETPYHYTSFTPTTEGYPPRRRDEFPVAHELTLQGGSDQLLYQRIPGGRNRLDQLLSTMDLPWDGITALMRDGLGILGTTEGNVRIQFIAPLEVALEQHACTLSEDGTLRVKVKAATAAVGRLSTLGYTGTAKDGAPIADSLPLDHRRWTPGRRTSECVLKHKVKDAARLTLLLRIGSHVGSRLEIRGPSLHGNPRFSAYATVDSEVKRLKQMLFSADGTKSKEFERAVARLFVLAGFAVDMFADDPKAGHAADAIAYDDLTCSILVLECTTGPLNQDGKLARLKKRAADVREAVGHLGTAKPQAILISSLQADRLSAAELEAAGRDRMAVLSREDLEQILQWASDGEPAALVLELINNRLPRFGMTGLIGHWG